MVRNCRDLRGHRSTAGSTALTLLWGRGAFTRTGLVAKGRVSKVPPPILLTCDKPLGLQASDEAVLGEGLMSSSIQGGTASPRGAVLVIRWFLVWFLVGTATSAMAAGWRGLLRRQGSRDDGGSRGRALVERWRRRARGVRVVLTVGPAVFSSAALKHLGPGLGRLRGRVFRFVVHGLDLWDGSRSGSGSRDGSRSGGEHRGRRRSKSRRIFGIQVENKGWWGCLGEDEVDLGVDMHGCRTDERGQRRNRSWSSARDESPDDTGKALAWVSEGQQRAVGQTSGSEGRDKNWSGRR